MSLEQQLRQAVHHVADRTPVPEVDLDAVRARARTNWRPRVAVAVTAAVVVIILAATSLLIGRGGSKPEPLGPVKPPGILVGAVPVWYDAGGLHRGDVVEKTPVRLFTDTKRAEDHVALGGVLALVRRGAFYRDPTNDDVWFHPWGGEPRVVGHDSSAGPGGDPDGDVAAWFDGEELVVYDTARGRELSRTKPGDDDSVELRDARVVRNPTEHVTGGNGFKHVSAEEVVWRATDTAGILARMYRLDVSTGKSTIVWEAEEGKFPSLEDMHGATRLWGDCCGGTKEALRIEVTGREELRLGVEPLGKLSADGSFVLTATCPARCAPHGAAIADVHSGEIWNLPYPDFYATIAWSYGDLAMVEVDQKPGREDGKSLVACNAATRQCHQLPRQGNVLLPTS